MFEKYLRDLGLIPEDMDDATKAIMRKAFDLQVKAGERNDNGESQERASQIMQVAGTVVASATDKVARGVLDFASTLVADEKVTVKDAMSKIRAKVVELGKSEEVKPEPDTQMRQFVVTSGEKRTMSKDEIKDAMNYQAADRSVRREIAQSVIAHLEAGENINLREFDKIEGKATIPAVIGDGNSGQVRSVTASAVTAVYQDIGTIMLQRNYGLDKDITDALVTVIPSTMNENNFPNVEAENGVRKVKEGEAYPIISGSTDDVKIGHTKYGAAISQTLESSIFDRIGYVQALLASVARQIRMHRASLRLHRVVSSTAFDGKYVNFPGSSDGLNDLYNATPDVRGNFNLVVSNALAATANISAARTRLRKMKLKDGTLVRPNLAAMLVPDTLYEKAWELVNAIYKPNSSESNPQQFIPNIYGPNGAPDYVKPVVISDPELDTLTAGTTTWYAGEFKSQFYEKVVWEPRLMPVVASADLLMRDVVGLWIASCCTEVCAVSKMFVVKNISAAS